MDISIKEILDYCTCPMLYKYKYKTPELKTQQVNLIEKYDHDIHKTIFSFFSSVQANNVIAIRFLMQTWGETWIGNKTSSDIIYETHASWRDSHNERRKKGIDSLVNVYNAYKDNPGFVIALNKSYRIPIFKDVYLTGTWQIIREVEDKDKIKRIEIVHYKTDVKQYNEININNDLESTASSFAFNKTFNIKEDRLVSYCLDNNKIQYTYRDSSDYNVLKNTIRCVSIAILNNLYYACPDSKCHYCAYKAICNTSLKNMVE